jgi:hypothetical protein
MPCPLGEKKTRVFLLFVDCGLRRVCAPLSLFLFWSSSLKSLLSIDVIAILTGSLFVAQARRQDR